MGDKWNLCQFIFIIIDFINTITLPTRLSIRLPEIDMSIVSCRYRPLFIVIEMVVTVFSVGNAQTAYSIEYRFK